MSLRIWVAHGAMILLVGCGGNLGPACADWVDAVNAVSCMQGDLAVEPTDHCGEATLDYYAQTCKDDAAGHYECFIPVCDDNDFPDWPTDCPALCN